MEPTLIGYFPKRVDAAPDWLLTEGVKEVCSVSEHVSPGPEGWIDRWLHNEMWAFDGEEAAWAVVPDGPSNAAYRMFAYRLFPVEFDGGEQRPFAIPPLAVKLPPAGYRRLGYDAVSRSCGSAFECSPLSCNSMAEQTATNRYCLVDDAQTAFHFAAEFEAQGCEPGPYYVVEVWREVKT